MDEVNLVERVLDRSAGLRGFRRHVCRPELRPDVALAEASDVGVQRRLRLGDVEPHKKAIALMLAGVRQIVVPVENEDALVQLASCLREYDRATFLLFLRRRGTGQKDGEDDGGEA